MSVFDGVDHSAGQSLRIASGTYTGIIDNLANTATICVDSTATFKPNNMNNVAGKLLNYGTAELQTFAYNTGTVIDNYGTLKFLGGLNTNGAVAFYNRANATMTMANSFQLGNNSTFINDGLVSAAQDFNTQQGTTLTNNYRLETKGNFNPDGIFINNGRVYSEKFINMNANLDVTNNCLLVAFDGFNSNNPKVTNNGTILITKPGNKWQHNAPGTFRNGANAKVAGQDFINNATITGSGAFIFSGTTTNQGTFAGNSSSDKINFYDETQTGSQIFDAQNTAPTNAVRTAIARPTELDAPQSCSVNYRSFSQDCPNGSLAYNQTGNASSQTKSGTVNNPNNAIDALTPVNSTANNTNSASVGASGVLSLDLGTVIPAGSPLIISLAQDTTSSRVKIETSLDGVTYTSAGTFGASGTLGSSTTLDKLSRLTLPVPAGGIRYVRFVREASTNWVDGVEYSQTCQTISYDFGDAPASYGDAHHVITSGLKLGTNAPDAETASQNTGDFSYNAKGDGDDEDGAPRAPTNSSIVQFPLLKTLDSSYSSTFKATNTTGAAAKLYGWIDFDKNGTFDTDEATSIDVPTGSTDSTVTLNWNTIPNDIQPGTTYIRLRLTSDSSITTSTPSSRANDGEVEDFPIGIALVLPPNSPDVTVKKGETPANCSTNLFSDDFNDLGAGQYFGANRPGSSGIRNWQRSGGGTDTRVRTDGMHNTTNGTALYMDSGAIRRIFPEVADTPIADTNGVITSPPTAIELRDRADDLTPNTVDSNVSGSHWGPYPNVLSRSFTTTAGQRYRLYFDLLPETLGGNVWRNGMLRVDTPSGTVYLQTPSSSDSKYQYQVEFTATGASSTISFSNYGRIAPAAWCLPADTAWCTIDGLSNTPKTSEPIIDNVVVIAASTCVDKDFGDAPTSYGDASHGITSNLFLGDNPPNTETSSKVSFNARADDNDDGAPSQNAPGQYIPLFPVLKATDTSYTIPVKATNTTGATATLSGWIDFDQSGTFEESEKASVTVPHGTDKSTVTLNWATIPTTIQLGTTAIRLRLSTDSNMTATGFASNGEVEDYPIAVAMHIPPNSPNISIVNNTTPASCESVVFSDDFNDLAANSFWAANRPGASNIRNWSRSDGGNDSYARTVNVNGLSAQYGTSIYFGNGAVRQVHPPLNSSGFNFDSNGKLLTPIEAIALRDNMDDVTSPSTTNVNDHGSSADWGPRPVTLSRTFNTTPGKSYRLYFTALPEDNGTSSFPLPGVMRVDAPGGSIHFKAPASNNTPEKYAIEFTALSTTSTIRFINYGHIHSSNNGYCDPNSVFNSNPWCSVGGSSQHANELIIDDVVLTEAACATGSIAGKVYVDTNRNGIYDASSETGIANVTVKLYDESTNRLVSTASTDNNGGYSFTYLDTARTYRVEVDTTDPDVAGNFKLSTVNPLNNVSVSANSITNKDFGFNQQALSCAPPPATTTYADSVVTWNHNQGHPQSAAGGHPYPTILNSNLLASAANETVSNLLTGPTDWELFTAGGSVPTTLQQALNENKYFQYSFTTKANLGNGYVLYAAAMSTLAKPSTWSQSGKYKLHVRVADNPNFNSPIVLHEGIQIDQNNPGLGAAVTEGPMYGNFYLGHYDFTQAINLEPNKTYYVRFYPYDVSEAGIAGGTGGRIIFDDLLLKAHDCGALPSTLLTVSDAVTLEGNTGLTYLKFAVNLSANAPAGGVSLNYSTNNGTATIGDNDYQATSGTVTIPAGQNSAVISIPVVGDTQVEDNETLTLTISSVTNARYDTDLHPKPPQGVIINDDNTSACNASSGHFGGIVFQDFNQNGLRDNGEIGLANVTVTAYAANNTVAATTTTDSQGWYVLSGLTNGIDYRLEFTNLPPGIEVAASNGNSGSNVQFVTVSPSCNANLGVAYPADYCQAEPKLLASRYINGDNTKTGLGQPGTFPALLSFSYNASGVNASISHDALASQVGSIWGLAYNRHTKRAFATAMLRRYVGLGSLGLGGIYVVDYNTNPPTVNNFLNVQGLTGINVGSIGSNTARGLPDDPNTPSHDATAFANVGKAGLGAAELAEDGNTLYVTNLYQRNIIKIDLTNYNNNGTPPTTASQLNLPNVACTNGVARPFALKHHRGQLYAGITCTGENNGTSADLKAFVYAYNGSTWVEKLQIPLNYRLWHADHRRRDTTKPYENWYRYNIPWRDNLSDFTLGQESGGIKWADDAQLLLSDIEFDTNGDMILAFLDRTGLQFGHVNYGTNTSDTTQMYAVFANGDLLKASYNPANGNYTLESEGKVNGINGEGVKTGSNAVWPYGGIGDGEFYGGERFSGHTENSFGAVAFVPGKREVTLNAMNPFNLQTGGTIWLSNDSGNRTRGVELYGENGRFLGKAIGLGDIEVLCDPAPVEIGNRVWHDTDKDGIQDAGENGINNVSVTLTCGTDSATTTTNSAGEYYFSNAPGKNATFMGNGESCSLSIANAQASLNGFTLTTANADGKTDNNAQTDIRDSDAAVNGNNAVINFTAGNAGQNNHGLDFGYQANSSPPPNTWTTQRVIDDCFGTSSYNPDGAAGAENPPCQSYLQDIYENWQANLAGAGDTDIEQCRLGYHAGTENYYFFAWKTRQAWDYDNTGESREYHLELDTDHDSPTPESPARSDILVKLQPRHSYQGNTWHPVGNGDVIIYHDADNDVGCTNPGQKDTEGCSTGYEADFSLNQSDAFVRIFNGQVELAIKAGVLNGLDNVKARCYASQTSTLSKDELDWHDQNDATDLSAHRFDSTGFASVGPNTSVSSVSGKVFEDKNYGGGAGRPATASGAVGINNVRVELYNATGGFVTSTTTDTDGNYTFNNLASGNYFVRVVNGSVRSKRFGSNGTERGVQTFRSDGTTATANEVGGRKPALVDAAANTTNQTLNPTDFTLSGGGQAQSVQPITISGSNISGADFGFNFSTVVNANDSGQGSLRQFLSNASLLGDKTTLAQAGLTAGKETAVFMLPTTDPNYNATDNYWSIALQSALPSIGNDMVLDGSKQAGFTNHPVIELNGTNAGNSTDGLTLNGSVSGAEVSNLAINRFKGAGIKVLQAQNNKIMNNVIGLDPTATLARGNQGNGITISMPLGSNSVSNNRIAYNGGDGINATGQNGRTVFITANSIYANTKLGIDLANNGITLNDANDTDTGINNLLNFPMINNAQLSGNSLTLSGCAPAGATVELFKADVSPTGTATAGANKFGKSKDYGEGQVYLGRFVEGSTNDTSSAACNLAADADGNNQTGMQAFQITVNLLAPLSAGDLLTATATVTTSGTSEFSPIYLLQDQRTLSGRVFEDINYGGGAGRDFDTSKGMVGIVGASVELVNSTNAVVANTTTAADGTYTFTAIPAGVYSVRVVADSVNSSRSGSNGTELGVITYRTDGTTPTTTVGAATAQAVDITLSDLSGVNFGFNFDTVSNTNDSGAGSLRQFILNANLLGGDSNLQQDGLPAGKENAVLMLSNTDPNYSNGVWKITLNSSLPNIDKPLILDGSKQTGFNLANARPVIELNGNGGAGNGLTLVSGSSGSQIRSLAITNFGGDGINVQGNSTNNSFLGNSIHSNGDLGIDLNNDGVTANDAGDSDTGPNNLLNFPEAKVNSFGTNGTKVVSYDFNLDLAAGDYRVEFFSNAAKDPSGHGEGQTYLGYKDITHLGNGSVNVKGTLNANQSVASGAFISTTLTRKTGANTFAETSEFSGVRDGITTQVCEDLALGTGSDMMVDEGATVIKLLEAKDKDGNPITYVISGGADKDMFIVENPTAGSTLKCSSIKFISSTVVVTKSAPIEAQTRAMLPPGFPPPGNFEIPLDKDKDNVYELQITATYANGSKIVRDLKVGVINLNEAPLITSPTSISVAEDSKADVLDIAAQDPDTGTTEANGLTFSISGGADTVVFSITPSGGVLRFITHPDYDAPQDANRDNVYEVEITVTDEGGLTDTKLFKVTVTNNPADDGIAINVKALLQGAYDGKSGKMAIQLKQLGLLPNKQPYNVAPFNYKGTESLSTAVQQASGNDAVVDWVLVELRAANNAVVASRALILQSDGDVVDPQSGTTQLHFANIPAGNYAVSLRHRNHLAVVTASTVSLSGTAQMLDFAAAATAVKGAGSRLIAGTTAMLWAGDINGSHTLTANGPSNDVTTLLSSVITHSDNAQGQTNYIIRGYLPTDVNLDGKTQFSGPGNDTSLLVGNILLHPLNTGFAANYIVRGGLAQ